MGVRKKKKDEPEVVESVPRVVVTQEMVLSKLAEEEAAGEVTEGWCQRVERIVAELEKG
jgi:hypothetical protein